MSKAFPELPRDDCPFDSPLEAISGPMLPKPLWTGATSYNDPNYPSGGGPDDVPPAPPSMGQALPATVAPPAQTSMGGGGGESKDYEIYKFKNGGSLPIMVDHIMKVSGCRGWDTTDQCYLLELNDVPCNLTVFICISSLVNPGETGFCYCLNGRVYVSNKIAYDAGVLRAGGSIGAGWEIDDSDTKGGLIPTAVGFRIVAIDDTELVHFTRDMMPSQLMRVIANTVGSPNVTLKTVQDVNGQLGNVSIPAFRTDF